MGKTEILHKIKVAEEKVRVMVSEAEERRKQLQAEGKRAAMEKIVMADTALNKRLDSQVSEVRVKIDAQKKRVLEDGAMKAAALTSSAQRRLKVAKEFVLSEFERAIDA